LSSWNAIAGLEEIAATAARRLTVSIVTSCELPMMPRICARSSCRRVRSWSYSWIELMSAVSSAVRLLVCSCSLYACIAVRLAR
jgi:hypothetical protein